MFTPTSADRIRYKRAIRARLRIACRNILRWSEPSVRAEDERKWRISRRYRTVIDEHILEALVPAKGKEWMCIAHILTASRTRREYMRSLNL